MLKLILGPDSLESKDHALLMAKEIKKVCEPFDVELVFKASFDKANRTSIESFRGLGTEKAKEIFSEIREVLNLNVTTDIHLPEQALVVSSFIDEIQIPALLSRQTDLLVAAGKTGKQINIKKGQFISPKDIVYAVNKVKSTGNDKITVIERGTVFGHNDIVVDFRGFKIMKDAGLNVIFDASHTVQLPSALDGKSGGNRELIPSLAKAAVAAGADGVFIEVHNDPENALCDGKSSLNLRDLEGLVKSLIRVYEASK